MHHWCLRNGRATASVNGSSITSLDCCAFGVPRRDYKYPNDYFIFLAIRKMRVIEALQKLKRRRGVGFIAFSYWEPHKR
jgi:hypothetical protein